MDRDAKRTPPIAHFTHNAVGSSLPGCPGNADLIGLGQALCADLASTGDPLLEANSLVANRNLTKQYAAVVVGSAIGAYCPEWVPVLHQASGN